MFNSSKSNMPPTLDNFPPEKELCFPTGYIDEAELLYESHYLCLCVYDCIVFACVYICIYIFAYRPSVNALSPSYNQINSWVASIVPRVSGPADYTNGHRCMQSVSLSFVCVSAQQSDEMSVSGEEIDEHTPETKRLATGNT